MAQRRRLGTALVWSIAAHLLLAMLGALLRPLAPPRAAPAPEEIVLLENVDPARLLETAAPAPETPPTPRVPEKVEARTAIAAAPTPAKASPTPAGRGEGSEGTPGELALLDAAAARALAGEDEGAVGEAPAIGSGEPKGEIDLFPEDILREWVESGIPKGEEEEIRAMLARYIATTKAYNDVRAGLVDPYATSIGPVIADAWEERILPKEERTLDEGVKRWWRELKRKPFKTVGDTIAAWATTPMGTPESHRREGLEPPGTVADIADAWEYGARRGLVLIGIRSDGTVLPIRILRSTGHPVFDDALTDAVTDAVRKVGKPSARLASRTGEAWMLYEVTAAITIIPPSPAVAGRFAADFSETELLYPFKILVDARVDLKAVFSSGEEYDPTAPPLTRVVDPTGAFVFD